jgi:hypothetical protein
METLQSWASTGGSLYLDIDISKVWDWWCELFDKDTAVDSAEYRAVKKGAMKGPVPEHPLHHFPLGSLVKLCNRLKLIALAIAIQKTRRDLR